MQGRVLRLRSSSIQKPSGNFMRSPLNQFLACIIANVLLIAPAAADYVPYFVSAPFNYFSTDLSPIEVSLGFGQYDDTNGTIKSVRRDPAKGFVNGPPFAVVSIPRAYIMSAEHYSSSRKALPGYRHEILPDKIVTNRLVLAVTYPDGSPLSVSYDAFQRKRRDLSLLGKDIDKIRKDKQARAIVLLAEISLSLMNNVRDKDVLSRKIFGGPEYVGLYEGFKQFRDRSGLTDSQYFYDVGPDDIVAIKCSGDGARTPPDFYCKYRFPLNQNIMVSMDFLDFRLHGGRAFARERIRAFKKFACPIFRCDEKALKATEVEGGIQ
jgi:hypothetical protein